MPIDPQLLDYYARVARELPPPAQLDVDARRQRMEAIARRFPAPDDRVARRDRRIAMRDREIPVRVYRPAPGPKAALVYFHGGGWIAGSIATHDGTCAALAQDADTVVISVEYRRSPEHPWPAPNDDARDVLDWVHANARDLEIDDDRIGVGGDSAGAHLAACLALAARDHGRPPICAQLLIYPVIAPDFDTASYLEHAITPSLTRDDMIWYWSQYLPQSTDAQALAAIPSRAASHAGLPPAHVVVAQYDPLRDEGVHYAGLLVTAGVRVIFREERALTHGFLRAAPYVERARTAQRALGLAIGELLRAPAVLSCAPSGPSLQR